MGWDGLCAKGPEVSPLWQGSTRILGPNLPAAMQRLCSSKAGWASSPAGPFLEGRSPGTSSGTNSPTSSPVPQFPLCRWLMQHGTLHIRAFPRTWGWRPRAAVCAPLCLVPPGQPSGFRHSLKRRHPQRGRGGSSSRCRIRPAGRSRACRLAGSAPQATSLPKLATASSLRPSPAGFPVSREPSPSLRQAPASPRASISPPAAAGLNIPIPGVSSAGTGWGSELLQGDCPRHPLLHVTSATRLHPASHCSWTSARLTPGPNPRQRHWAAASIHQGASPCPAAPKPPCLQAPLSPRHPPAQTPGRCRCCCGDLLFRQEFGCWGPRGNLGVIFLVNGIVPVFIIKMSTKAPGTHGG